MIVGYKRVSTIEQNTARQLDGIELEEVFEDKLSGSNMERPELKRCLGFLRKKDILCIHSIDRLARSNRDLQNIVGDLIDKGVIVKFITENLEFGNKDNPMLDAMATFEANIVKERQAIGIAKAKANGVKSGKPSLSSEKIKEIKRRSTRGDTAKDISKKMKIAVSTVYKYR